jgi:EmrB/QacA subfamily drug resistance transporter
VDAPSPAPHVAVLARLLREPRRPAAVRGSPRARWFVVATVCIGAFMGQLDVSIVTLALPHIGADLHAGAGAVRWVALSYLLTLVGTLTVVGHLADRVGRKLLYTYGFAVFTLGSLLCGLAPGLGWLLAARVLQGLGAALLQANSVALIATALPRRELARGLGVQGAAQAIGLALGPALGGLLLALGGWRLIFLVNLPAGVPGIALGWLLLPRSRLAATELRGHTHEHPPEERGERFDWAGATLLAAALGALMLLISLASQLLEDPVEGVLLAAFTATLFAGLCLRERRAAAPILDLELLRRPALALGLTSAAAAYLVMFGTLYVVPYYLAAHGVPVALAGLQLATLPVALGVVAPVAGRIAGARNAQALTGGGLLLAALGLLVLAADHDGFGRLAGLAFAGAGLGAFVPVNNAGVVGAAPNSQAGALSGVLNTTRGVGTALGVAVAGLIYTAAAGDRAAAHLSGGQPPGGAAGHGLTVTLVVLAMIALIAAAALCKAATGCARRDSNSRPSVP